MTESEALERMIVPSQRRSGKKHGGVMQILVTSSCNLACNNCTQASNIKRPHWEMTPDQFEQACVALKGYWGTIGVFGGDPCLSSHFEEYCVILQRHFPKKQCGLWSNRLYGHGAICRATFDPGRSNLNVHMDREAYDEMKRDWPESRPFGLEDSRHSPVWGSMIDLDIPEDERWDAISRCSVNQHWSALIGVRNGVVQLWFCEIAAAQSILHSDDPDYDTGIPVYEGCWQAPRHRFYNQIRHHCHRCLVPLNGYGELAVNHGGASLVTEEHADNFRPKKGGVVRANERDDLEEGRIGKLIDYVGNAKR